MSDGRQRGIPAIERTEGEPADIARRKVLIYAALNTEAGHIYQKLGNRALARASFVSALRLFPGISPELVRNVLRPPLQGLVLEAYGVGNGPDQDSAFIDALTDATKRGVVIVDCTQCLEGTVDLDEYAAGSALARAGVISGFDMTAEAALAKLYYLFGRGDTPDRVKREMQIDLRGELTITE